jgi:hypothetical protein
MRIKKAKTNIKNTRNAMLLEKPIIKREIAWIRSAITRGHRLSYFDDSHPEIGKPISWLTGITKSKVPNSASLMSSAVLIVGIRDAQLEKLSPDKKKKTPIAMRCFVFVSS